MQSSARGQGAPDAGRPPTHLVWPLEMYFELANHDYTLLLCGPSRQWPGTSLHIGVGGVLGHPPGAFTHCGNRLGSPLFEPPWISIVYCVLGTGLDLRCGNRLGSPLRNAFWELVWISVVGTGLDLGCGNLLGSPLCKHAWISITTTPFFRVCRPLVYFADPPGNGRAPLFV